jgi:hypothetical protein
LDADRVFDRRFDHSIAITTGLATNYPIGDSRVPVIIGAINR